MEQEYYTTNNVAMIIKRIAVLLMILGIIAGIITIFVEVVTGIIILSISIIIPLLFYAIGEITEILHDIKTNSEHIRDYLEKRG